MTESEWVEGTDPMPMVEFLLGKASDRKLRLFAVACCRRLWPLLTDERSQRALDKAEEVAEGKSTIAMLHGFNNDAYVAQGKFRRNDKIKAALAASYAAWSWGESPIQIAARGVLRSLESFGDEIVHAYLLRDIFGNPFHTITLDPRWQTSTVVDLAQAIYDEKVFDRMPILADALTDAGCHNEEIIAHCRSEGPHVRGCWVVDLLLGKEVSVR